MPKPSHKIAYSSAFFIPLYNKRSHIPVKRISEVSVQKKKIPSLARLLISQITSQRAYPEGGKQKTEGFCSFVAQCSLMV